MDRISFDIYIPDGKKFHWTPNWIMLVLVAVTIAFCEWFGNYAPPYSALREIWLGIVLLIFIWFEIASFFTYKPLNGTLEGKIVFEDDSLTINDKKYILRNINALDFSFVDYYGKRSLFSRDLNPTYYQGVSNYVTFTDNLIQKQLIYFKFFGEHSYMALSPFINEAIKLNKMSRERGVTLLGEENLLI